MSCRAWIGLTSLIGLAFVGCFQAPVDPAGDCLRAGTCECASKADCAPGLECIDGRCEVLPDAGPGEGELGAVCTRNGECNSGRCLPPGPGRSGVCTVACDADNACPGNWECKPAGAENLCTPPFNSLCLSCETDRDCNSAGDLCLEVGGSKVCGRDCSFTGCPAGYTCEDLPGPDGGQGAAKQCIPTTGTCECTDLTVGLGRGCRNANDTGTCYGFELCRPDGTWAGCDALTPSKEVCNGIDDDCDGLLDTGDSDVDVSTLPASPAYPACRNGSAGACVGTWMCAELDGGFGWTCGAVEPREELCNGLDEDCNGVVDEPFLTAQGQYGVTAHCGACGYDCEVAVEDLATGLDGGVAPGAVACELRSGAPTCVPKLCAPGYSPYPVDAPVMCLKAVSSACRTCSNDLDCSPFGDRCIPMGDDPGAWCAQRCDAHAPYEGCTGAVGEQGCCPGGYSCEQVGADRLCIPEGDSCTCSPARAGATRSCLVALASNTCVGQQTCGATGEWDSCDTSQTTVEVCDDTDNNCDGRVDEQYKNTRGSGTYDTDEQCGNCQTNCKAMWNPAIQHAIGGCNAGLGNPPNCEIVGCTQESIPGGGACQVDADCGAGRTCHPLYQQCVRACATSADCGGGTCSNGSCTAACTTDAQCEQAFGKPSTCTNGACSVRYQFVNADKEPTNGCECPAAAGGVDVPDVYASYPQAGVPYVDRDCDLVDGVAATSLFVRSGATGGNGSRGAPFGSIGQAITAYRPGTHSAILVAAGTYVEQVIVKNGVKLFGGYSTDFTRRDVVSFPTLIEAPEPDFASLQHRRGTVNAEGIFQETVIAGFTVRGYDVTFRPAPGNPGRNSYAVYVKDSSSMLRIANNHIIGGRAGDGAHGNPGTAGANGGSGGDGRDATECSTPGCFNESQSGAAGGGNASCPGANGTSGAPSVGGLFTQGYQQPLGKNGQGGVRGTYTGFDGDGNGTMELCKYDCQIGGGTGQSMNGLAAQNGVDGAALVGGSGCQNPSGSIIGDEWIGSFGGTAANGTPGSGGGGGGSGGFVENTSPPSCTVGRRVGDLGGSGGGGGAGGCGGGAGSGGGSGGGSFAVFVVFSATPALRPVIEGNIIDPGAGGNGGNGGQGGYGGAGGTGGEGGIAALPAWCAGSGGHGGRGGNGAAGSGGGGGCGGPSFGISGNFLGPANYTAKNTATAPPASAGGDPGAGGASPAGSTSTGRSGSAGVVGALRSF